MATFNAYALFDAPLPTPAPLLDAPGVYFVQQLNATETLAACVARTRQNANLTRHPTEQVTLNGPADWGDDRFVESTTAQVRSYRPGWLTALAYSRDSATRQASLHASATEPVQFVITLANGEAIPGAGDWTLAYQNTDRVYPALGYTDALRANPVTNGQGGLLTGVGYVLRMRRSSTPNDVFLYSFSLDVANTQGGLVTMVLLDDPDTTIETEPTNESGADGFAPGVAGTPLGGADFEGAGIEMGGVPSL